ncbi:MAG: hypothetical protein HY904_01495 [Deltaproteobacteria bacterium]|nr:hypothetical protein [Deltaproteobacteria bacterium]
MSTPSIPLTAACVLASLALAGCPACNTTDDDDSGTSSSGGTASSSSGGSGGGSSGAAGSSSQAAGSSGVAVSSSSMAGSSGTGSSVGGGSSLGGSSSAPAVSRPAYVFAHSDTVLYRLDADTLNLTELGAFTFEDAAGTPITNATMTDFAVTAGGQMWGCSLHTLWRIESPTWRAIKVADLVESFTGLTFVPAGMLEANEVLVGATQSDGSLYKIDRTDGTTTLIGSYGDNWATSGDIVAITNDGMYATVKRTGETTDFLARIEPTTGVATIIGTQGIGALKTFGLGYWGGVLYAFTDEGTGNGGKVLQVNRSNGIGTVIRTENSVRFWGAGVTTIAKIN